MSTVVSREEKQFFCMDINCIENEDDIRERLIIIELLVCIYPVVLRLEENFINSSFLFFSLILLIL